MKLLIFIVGFAFALVCADARADVWQPSPGHTQVSIWPGAVPDALPSPRPESDTTETNF